MYTYPLKFTCTCKRVKPGLHLVLLLSVDPSSVQKKSTRRGTAIIPKEIGVTVALHPQDRHQGLRPFLCFSKVGVKHVLDQAIE